MHIALRSPDVDCNRHFCLFDINNLMGEFNRIIREFVESTRSWVDDIVTFVSDIAVEPTLSLMLLITGLAGAVIAIITSKVQNSF